MTFRCFKIKLRIRSLPRGPRCIAVRRLPRMQEVEFYRGQYFNFHNSHHFIKSNVKNCFVKLILKYKNFNKLKNQQNNFIEILFVL